MFATREDNSGNGEEGDLEELDLVAERSLRAPRSSVLQDLMLLPRSSVY